MDMFPLWAAYVATVVLVLVAAEIGFRIGMWLQRRDPASGEIRVTGTMVGGMLGLMAFLMAFSIGIVINQHNGRKVYPTPDAINLSGQLEMASLAQYTGRYSLTERCKDQHNAGDN